METCIKEEKVEGRQKHTDPQPVPNPINESSKSSHKTTVGGVLVLLAWVLLILQSMALFGGWGEEGQGWERFKYLLQQSPQGAMGYAIGSFIGSNILALPATILGLIIWLYQKNKNGKIIVSVGVVLICIQTAICL